MWSSIFLCSGRLMILLCLLLQLAYHGLAHVRSMHYVSYPQKNAFTDTTAMEPCTGYFCNNGMVTESRKIQRLHRHKEFVHRVQKKICEQIFNSIKMRLRIKKLNIDNPCNN
ncbi:uncharacterized protein LOC113554843 [Rhopalosiphum maidis]|uniref:uncharacterized protein LOC113554843 n=1 Tax=Rhopalosiphum maidis TaxID=43146 RepID=UPI000F00B9C4|nr:uncharacterized protein LOC113554843 [Rhopalosiphum maidis]